jgi:hypothetical protein
MGNVRLRLETGIAIPRTSDLHSLPWGETLPLDPLILLLREEASDARAIVRGALLHESPYDPAIGAYRQDRIYELKI